MKFSIYKAKTAVAFILVLLMASVTLMANVSVKAAEVTVSGTLPAGKTPALTVPTQASLSVKPRLVGVGQSVLVNAWINPSGPGGRVFRDYEFTITKPDGNKSSFTTNSEPATSAIWFNWIVDQVGTWKFKFDFPGLYCNGSTNEATQSCYYQPSSSPETTVTVQTDMVASWPPAPLPTDYWTRPASLNNREWWPILGSYPGTGYLGINDPQWSTRYPGTNPYDSAGEYSFNPWVQGPNTAHVVWKRLSSVAGLIGGPAGIYGTTAGGGSPSIIYAGRAYQTVTKPMQVLVNGTHIWQPTSVWECYDIRTGEVYWDLTGITAAPNLVEYTPKSATSGSGTWSVSLMYIGGGRLIKYNPSTGAVTLNISIPLSSGTYYTTQHALTLQDLGAAAANATGGRYRLINWTTAGTSTNFTSRIRSNITWPWSVGPGDYSAGVGICSCDFNLGLAGFVTRIVSPTTGIMWGLNVSACNLKTGAVLWGPTAIADEATYSGSCVVADHGKFAFLTQKGTFIAYDLQTGQQAWKSERMDYPWGSDSFGAYAIQSAYGMLFRQAYDCVYAFDWDTGKIVWKYSAYSPAPFESPYTDVNGTEVFSFNAGAIIADGKMYTYNTEHTPTYPTTRGWGIHCINITTGEGIWKLNNPMVPGAVADGYLAASNGWDGTMYVFGRGKSATTVTASPKTIGNGATVLIEGTVLDQSPAQPGTPCVSHDSMSTQMEYLHLQQSIGGLWGNETIIGVPVNLLALDANGTATDLGTVTTNGYYGTFSKEWTPPAEGTYQIIATFAADDSYGSSSAATGISVGPAPTPIVFPEQPTVVVPDYTMAIIGAAVAMIIAVALATVLILRKR